MVYSRARAQWIPVADDTFVLTLDTVLLFRITSSTSNDAANPLSLSLFEHSNPSFCKEENVLVDRNVSNFAPNPGLDHACQRQGHYR
jgi:hypothetical protein